MSKYAIWELAKPGQPHQPYIEIERRLDNDGIFTKQAYLVATAQPNPAWSSIAQHAIQSFGYLLGTGQYTNTELAEAIEANCSLDNPRVFAAHYALTTPILEMYAWEYDEENDERLLFRPYQSRNEPHSFILASNVSNEPFYQLLHLTLRSAHVIERLKPATIQFYEELRGANIISHKSTVTFEQVAGWYAGKVHHVT